MLLHPPARSKLRCLMCVLLCSGIAFTGAAQAAPSNLTAADVTAANETAARSAVTSVHAFGGTSLPLWTPPANQIHLPAPSGAWAVGVAASGFPDTEVYYPAVRGTGHGPHRYVEPAWARAAGLDPAKMDRVVSSAQIDATPQPTLVPRPMVLLNPGWRSIVAFSTSLAEDLASHGYIVLASQTDVATEWSHVAGPVPVDRNARYNLLEALLRFVEGPVLPALVGPIDLHRIAAGGHSYAGSVAFDVSLIDPRLTAVFDLDGSVRGVAGTMRLPRSALLLVTMRHGIASDLRLAALGRRSPHVVAVGLQGSLHLDVTDAAVMHSLLGTSVFGRLDTAIGATGTIDTSVIVRRFLDGALGTTPRLPTARQLASGLRSVSAHPFP
jgi:hypothetical protein